MTLRRWLPRTCLGARWLLDLARITLPSSRRGHTDGRASAGIIVIGDEILKAQVRDTNAFYACSLLYEHGVKVMKISVVADDVREIASEISLFSTRYTHVITIGGIGPTHDDVTYQALAAAFADKMHYHPTLVNAVRDNFGGNGHPSSSYKMAYVPKTARLSFGTNEATGEKLAYPCVMLRNVCTFPGSPMFFQPSFGSLYKKLFTGHKKFAGVEIFVNAVEERYADALSTLAKEYPSVTFGSYPERSRYYKARVTIESDSEEETEKARERFYERMPRDVLVRFDREPQVDCLAKYQRLLRGSSRRAIYENSFETLLELYRNPAEVLISIDGSVESTVLLHLARVVATKLNLPEKLRAIYFQSGDRHPGIDRFLRDIVERYDLEATVVPCRDGAECHRALERFAALEPELRTLLSSKRREPSSFENFSDIVQLRVRYPLIDWSTQDVAMFSNSLFLPYYAPEENRF